MEADQQEKPARKRRRPAANDASNASESALSDDTGSKPYSIRRRTQTKPSDDASSIHDKVGPSPSNSPAVTNDTEQSSIKATPVAAIADSPLQQATRELHARIMSRVRDLAPSFTPAVSKPPPVTIPTSPTTTPNVQSAPSPTITNSNNSNASKNTSRTVKELQHLITQYVQQQRANLGLANLNTGAISPTSNPNNNVNSNTSSRNIPNIPNPVNVIRTPTDIPREISNDNTFQKSSIIANKFSNAITKYARSATNNANNVPNHPTASGSHYAANGNKPFNQVAGSGHESGPSAPRSVASFTRPVSSVLDKNVPALSIQYKHNQKEKRRKTEYGYYDDTSSNSSDGNANYFLLAARHELQNMDEEMATIGRLEMMENEIERLQRGIAMRDRVIRKLHDVIDEKDELIQALPYELVSNWVAASHMMGQ